MWKTILDKIKGGILAYWSQVTWFVLGVLLGTMLLGGLVSCTKQAPAQDAEVVEEAR